MEGILIIINPLLSNVMKIQYLIWGNMHEFISKMVYQTKHFNEI